MRTEIWLDHIQFVTSHRHSSEFTDPLSKTRDLIEGTLNGADSWPTDGTEWIKRTRSITVDADLSVYLDPLDPEYMMLETLLLLYEGETGDAFTEFVEKGKRQFVVVVHEYSNQEVRIIAVIDASERSAAA